MSKVINLKVDKLLGLVSDNAGDTNLKIGQCSKFTNFKSIEGYKAKKRSGYLSQLTNATGQPIVGQWYGKIGASFFHLFASNGHIYVNLGTGLTTDLGTMTTPSGICFFYFGDLVHIINGSQHKTWSGTGNLVDYVAYVPKVMVSRNMGSTSTGTSLEGLNFLTNQRRMTFNGVSAQTVATLIETNITSVDAVYVNGVLKTVTTDYTVSLSAGTVTFVVAPPVALDNVEIKYTYGSSGSAEILRQTKARLYGGKNDNRVFLFGYDNEIYYSGLADGVPSATYFPVLNFIKVGSNNTKVTDLAKMFDRLIIFKESTTGWTSYEYDASLGVEFPTYPLNDTIGCTVMGTVQIIKNNPLTINGNTIQELVSSTVRDERNMKIKSVDIQPLLNLETMTSAITFDNQVDSEYWLILGTKVYIYNYLLEVWNYYEYAHTITSIENANGIVLGTSTGQLMRISTSYLTDNSTSISSIIETGYIDYGSMSYRKFLNMMWVAIKPEEDTSVDVYVKIDGKAERFVKTISYNNLNFADIDFSDFTFSTDYNPKAKQVNAKANDFSYIKIILKNTTNNRLTVLSIDAPSNIGGVSK